MNANELADEIGSILYPYCEEAATMLRQQQAEIEVLQVKYEVDYEAISWALHKLHSFGVTQSNMDNALMADRLELMLRKAQEK